MDNAFNRVFKKRVPNHLEHILQTLAPFRDQIKGFAVESTYNCHWLVDGLMDAGYSSAHLANPAAIKQYEGLKYSNDQHDVFFPAQLLILGVLPQGYIYPKKNRPVRDLGCKQLFLVQHIVPFLSPLPSKVVHIIYFLVLFSVIKVKTHQNMI